MPLGDGWTIQNVSTRLYLTIGEPVVNIGDPVVASEYPATWDVWVESGSNQGGPQEPVYRSVTRLSFCNSSRAESYSCVGLDGLGGLDWSWV
jgi:hypothetical protein